jgi:dienelactone hydrolase
MTEVLMFHHAQGLTPGLLALAERLRAAGHPVTTPDLYDGAVFDRLEDGVAHAGSLGFGALLERGERAADGLPDDLVYVGFSLGVLPAQKLAQTRPGARGALLVSSCIPAGEFGSWPASVALQVHAMEQDPLMVDDGDLEAARDLVGSVDGAELLLYPGDRHLFTDPSLSSYDEAAATLFTERVLAFLARVA